MRTNNDPRLAESLNRLLAKEHACAIRYATHAAFVTGPHVDAVTRRLQEIASDELEHAAKLRTRICALGGVPTMEVDGRGRPGPLTLGEILQENISEEREAIGDYTRILEEIPPLNVLLRRTLEDILKDEQEHLEELTALILLREEDLQSRRRRDRPEVRTGVPAPQATELSLLDPRD